MGPRGRCAQAARGLLSVLAPLGVLGLGHRCRIVGSGRRSLGQLAHRDRWPGGPPTAPGVAQGFEARIYAFNNSGGLDGRKIHFLGNADDAESSQTNLTNSQKLVESDHVMAVAPYISTTCSASGTGFLEQNKTPFVGWAVRAGLDREQLWHRHQRSPGQHCPPIGNRHASGGSRHEADPLAPCDQGLRCQDRGHGLRHRRWLGGNEDSDRRCEGGRDAGRLQQRSKFLSTPPTSLHMRR